MRDLNKLIAGCKKQIQSVEEDICYADIFGAPTADLEDHRRQLINRLSEFEKELLDQSV